MKTLGAALCLAFGISIFPCHAELFEPCPDPKTHKGLAPMVCSEITEEALLGHAHKIAQKLAEEGAINAEDYEGKNTKADYFWVVARGLSSAAAYTLYLHQSHGVDLQNSLLLGLTGLLLSGGFQATTPWYVKWVTKKGIFHHAKQDAGFVETWLKEYSLQWLYIGIFQLVTVMLGVEQDFMSLALVKTVTYSWITEGAWSLIIAKWVANLRDKMKTRPRLAWNLGKASYFGLSLLSSILMIASLHGSNLSEYVYYVMMATGVTGYTYFFTPLGEKLRSKVNSVRNSCRRKLWEVGQRKHSIEAFEEALNSDTFSPSDKAVISKILNQMKNSEAR